MERKAVFRGWIGVLDLHGCRGIYLAMEADTQRPAASSGYASGSGLPSLPSLAIMLIAFGVLMLWLDTLGYGREGGRL